MTPQEMEALVKQGEAIDGGAAAEAAEAANPEIPGAPPPDPDAGASEWIIIPEVLAWGITTAYPGTAAHYTTEAKMNLARQIAAVAEKYGLNGMSGSPELMLLMGAVAFAVPAVLAHRARKATHEPTQVPGQRGDGQTVVNGGADGS